jgi:hypothetical protein
MAMEKYGVENRKKLMQDELDQVNAAIGRLDKTAAADQVRNLNERKHALEDAIKTTDS